MLLEALPSINYHVRYEQCVVFELLIIDVNDHMNIEFIYYDYNNEIKSISESIAFILYCLNFMKYESDLFRITKEISE